MDMLSSIAREANRKLRECISKRAYYEKTLAEELDEKIDGDALNKLKVDEDIIFMKIFNFLYYEYNALLQFMLDNKLELFSNHDGVLTILTIFQDFYRWIENQPSD